jgi:hypothetical protein
MEKIVEIWEKILSYLSEFWRMISPYISQAWETITPFVMSVWEKFLSVFCQFGVVCSNGNLNWMGGTIIAVALVAVILLIIGVKILVQNRI